MRTHRFHRIFFFPIVAAAVAALSACAPERPQALTVWTYDSFVSEWGPASKAAALFKEKTGIDVEFVSKGDGGALLSALLAEGKKAKADIVIGLDDRQVSRALDSGLFVESDTGFAAQIPAEILVDRSKRLLPYDYGHFALVWDSASGTPAPGNLEDLTRPEYRKKLIIMDPRTSTVGMGFLGWVQAAYGEGWKEYLRRLAPSLLAMTPGWDVGYGLFTSGEAPLVLSYATSPAYHLAYDSTDRYRALLFPEGHAVQVELAGILGSSRHRKEARRFMDFLLSPECQALLPETQWMYPANATVQLPDSFRIAPKPARAIVAPLFDARQDPVTAAGILSGAAR